MGVVAGSGVTGYPDAVSLPEPVQHITARPQGNFFQAQRSPGVSGGPQAVSTAPRQPMVQMPAGGIPAGQPMLNPAQPSASSGQIMVTGYGDAPAWNTNPGIGNVVPAGQMTTTPVVPAF